MRDAMVANRRGVVLRALEEDPAHELSNEILQICLRSMYHRMTLTAVDALIDWLAERDLVTVTEVGGDVRAARLTRLGVEVAQRSTRIPGINLPTV